MLILLPSLVSLYNICRGGKSTILHTPVGKMRQSLLQPLHAVSLAWQKLLNPQDRELAKEYLELKVSLVLTLILPGGGAKFYENTQLNSYQFGMIFILFKTLTNSNNSKLTKLIVACYTSSRDK